MSALVRAIASLLAFGVVAGPVWLSLFVASVEPSRPVQVSWVAPFALSGLGAAAGYLIVATGPHRIAVSTSKCRLLVGCLLAVPCTAAIYLLCVTNSWVMVGFSLAVIGGTVLLLVACIWPAWLARANPSFQRTASGGR